MARYSIRRNRIESGYMTGLACTEDDHITGVSGSLYHALFLKGIDGAEKGASWGRLSFRDNCSEDIIHTVYVAATDIRDIKRGSYEGSIDDFLISEKIDVPVKIQFLKELGAKRFVSSNDMLLYELSGQYLYIAMEVTGEDTAEFYDIVVDSTGDNFMATFPEIYRERNSFFHRYMSIFSSIYGDFQKEIDDLPKLLDLDTCPVELLTIYGEWMGIDLSGGFLPEDILRKLVKNAYQLNRIKGTKGSFEMVLDIMLGEKAIVLEYNEIQAFMKEQETEVPAVLRGGTVYDVTILVESRLTEELRHQLLFILNQFKPARTRINLAQLDDTLTADSNSYLDVNARLPEEKGAVLDADSALDGVMTLV